MNLKILIIVFFVFLTSCTSNRKVITSDTGYVQILPLNLCVNFKEVTISDSSLFIEGTVIDTTNNIKLHGVNIFIANSLPGIIKCSVATNKNGNFILQCKNPTLTDTLFVRYIGYKDIEIQLTDFKNKYSK